MKIAMLYADWSKFGEPWSTPMGIRSELESRGHEVRHYNLYHDDGRLFPDNVRHYSNQGINLLMGEIRYKTYSPDVIFVMDYGPWDAVQFDKKNFPGSVLISEAGDEPQAHRSHWSKAARVHHVLSPDRQCVDHYNDMGHNAVYWTHHADIRIFKPMPETSVEFDCVTTCGSRGKGLTDEIKTALGDAFSNERYFHGVDHVKQLNKGKIVFQCSQFKEVTRRIFEGMACGKMVLTDRIPEETGLSEMFIDGEDIIYYDDAQDAIDKIKYYASHDEERERIALNGYNKVIANHSQVSRCDDIEKCVLETLPLLFCK